MKKEKFTVDFMILQRADLEFMDTNGKNISQTLTDQQMKNIASRLGRILAQEWDNILLNMKENRPEMFEVKK